MQQFRCMRMNLKISSAKFIFIQNQYFKCALVIRQVDSVHAQKSKQRPSGRFCVTVTVTFLFLIYSKLIELNKKCRLTNHYFHTSDIVHKLYTSLYLKVRDNTHTSSFLGLCMSRTAYTDILLANMAIRLCTLNNITKVYESPDASGTWWSTPQDIKCTEDIIFQKNKVWLHLIIFPFWNVLWHGYVRAAPGPM